MLRIKEVRKSQGLTQSQVADALGIHLSNYNKLENETADISMSRLQQIADVLHCEVVDLMEGHGQARTVTVKQHVAAGIWKESFEWSEDDWYEVAVPHDPEFRGVSLYAAETQGPSMNRVYPDGSAVIYTSVLETAEDLKVGRRYIIEIERSDGLREATIKKLWQDDTGKMWLLPESDDPRYQQPIDVSGAEGDNIRVVGRVVYSVRREP
ncbi:LexA family transcriptional regulator [Rhizobium sp. SU303]|uniref:LexA family transcriptional regulator n=1 Tax=Rhizobium sp. SU303 TaxID=3138065 RepID=UPI001E301906|nr:LexA family transcriptional regulator [Rhizobium leguminosarum]UFW79993.1 LexA family transcriptional regulator [Rhizobium leguminosarum bv. viciae]